MNKYRAISFIIVAFIMGAYLGANNNKYKEIVQINQSVPHMRYANK